MTVSPAPRCRRASSARSSSSSPASLQYLANEQVVHLDMKPGNVILGAPPSLVDLSVARTVEAAARIRTPVGTDAYMAPEQCDPTLAGIGTAADVYGLGATLYESIAGSVPFPRPRHFDREDPSRRFPQLSGVPAPLSDCPPALAEIVSACLSFDPGDRPTAGEVGDRLEPLIEAIKPRRILGRARPAYGERKRGSWRPPFLGCSARISLDRRSPCWCSPSGRCCGSRPSGSRHWGRCCWSDPCAGLRP